MKSSVKKTIGGDRALTKKNLISFYEEMLRIRIFEEEVARLLEKKEITCPTHLYIGQEAVAVGVCSALDRSDLIFGTHRSHGHYLAKGGNMNAMMAELFGKVTGCSRGRGGSMHLFANEIGILGTVPMVGATIPIAVGAALSAKLQDNGKVSVAFFGDGAVEEGVFHESLNFASLHRLPVIFVCENNLFSSHLRLSERQPSEKIVRFAKAHELRGCSLDGNDVIAVYEETVEAVKRARNGLGPTLIECVTYRWRGHVGPEWDLDKGIRGEDEVRKWMKRCPIKRLERRLKENQEVNDQEIRKIRAFIMNQVAESVTFARESDSPNPKEILDYVFS